MRIKGAGWLKSWSAMILTLALCFSGMVAAAQISGTGSISGTIEDSTGATVSGATVTLTNNATQVKRTAITEKQGLYSFPNIDIGTYTLTVTQQGFKTYTQSNIILEVGSSVGLNVTLTVGSATEEVNVSASGLALQTEDATFKQTIDEKTITELPLNGRQVTSLITLAGASVPSSSLTQGNKGFWSSTSPQIAGGQGNQSDYRLDGGDNNDYESNTSFAFPFPDAVAQFSVQSSVQSADTGLHPAGTINVVTKSGSNQWHGDVFEFIRNNYINATNFFSAQKDQLHQNQFGGTFGGRIIKDKLFFFGGYQRLRSSSASAASTAHVPTAAMLNGDFSAAESAPCITPTAAQKSAGVHSYSLLNPITGADLSQTGDKINPSYYNAASLALVKYLPQPEDDCGLVHFSVPTFQTENQYITRIDSVLTPKHALYGRYFQDDYVTPALYSPTNILITANPGNTEHAKTLTLGETWTISNNFVNTVHLTGTRRTNARGPAADGINASSLNINVYQPIARGLRVQGAGFNAYCSTCALGTFNVNSWSIIDDANIVIGKHQILFGGEYIRAQLNVNNSFSSNGTFNFSSNFSLKGPGQNQTYTPAPGYAVQTGNSLLDFLTGSMTTFSQSKPQQNAMRAPIPSLYIQDTYHATRRLVITAGLRWSAQFTPHDYFGRGSSFSLDAFKANQHSTRFPNAPAGSFFYGDPGIPQNFTKNYVWQFTPRLGVTFDPVGDGKTVFRAGAGLVYDETNFFASTETTQNPPFATLVTNTATTAPISFSDPWTGGTSPGNPFPQPFVPPSTQQFQTGLQFITYPLEFPTPYVMQWTASMQHQMSHGWQMQLQYIGNKTTHMPYGYPTAPVIYIPGNWTGAGTCMSAYGPLLTSPGNNKPCSSTGNSQARSMLTLLNPSQGPYYLAGGGGGASTLMVAGSNASYNALVATIQHRASQYFTFLANYTWSHCFDLLDNPGAFNTVAVQNPNNIHADYGPCGFDRRGIFNSSIVASTHFGVSGWRALAVNNWQIAPIIRATTGAPFNVTTGLDNSLTALGTDRPNYNGGNIYLHTHPVSNTNLNPNSLDVTKFTANPLGTYGNSPRNGFVGPKYFNIDAALSRSFPLYEQLALQLRLEAFNVLNHPNFGNPSASVNSPTSFGRVGSAQAPRIFQGAVKFTF
ncbi:MAG TPA: carboxypeptidase regulatory-like domain-containing protein [Acidobacteriaceae bacterium]|nr:carboxypeptidase regulatory-like domain-containing protein [Acidobacteriaceae bacterium]